MAQISSYPVVSPKLVDTFVVSQGYDPNAGNPIIGNPTGLVSIGGLVDLINSGLTPGSGTVTSVSGTGTVSGLTLTGTVTSTGSLTLGGTLTLTSSQITTGLGFTPYNDTNPNGFTSFAEPGIFSGGGTPTLASGVTGAEIRNLIGAGTSSLVLGTSSSEALAGDTVTISGSQASAISANTLKVSDTGTPAILSDESSPSLNTGITAAEIRTLIGAGTSTIDDNDYVRNTLDTYTGTDKVKQIITLSQAEYDAITTPLSDTLYIIL
jgi:hypothetical protein